VAVSTLHALLVAGLVLVIPLWDRHETRLLKTKPTSANRIRSYHKTIAWLWGATVLLLATVPWDALVRPSLPDIEWPRAARATVVGMTAGALLAMLIPVLLARANTAMRERLIAQFATIGFFLPASRIERRWFVAVCLSAGICEEVIYRGFLIRFLAEAPLALPTAAAIALAAAAFGIAHGYQGFAGVVSTAVIALFMTVAFLAAGHLGLPMVLHILIDLRILLVWPLEGRVPPIPPVDRAGSTT
jgi:membrane protease YdiL (CAAX protease family)